MNAICDFTRHLFFLLGFLILNTDEVAAKDNVATKSSNASLLGAKEVDLVTPIMTDEAPGAGKRVRQVASEYEGTDVYHALYLPVEWKPSGNYSGIVEYTGNKFPAGKGSGEVKDANLSYGMGGGRGFIWVTMPYVAKGRSKTQSSGGVTGKPLLTIAS